MPSRYIDWRDLSLFDKRSKTSTIREDETSELRYIADTQKSATRCSHCVNLASFCSKFLCDNFGCSSKSKFTRFSLGGGLSSSSPSEASVSLKDFIAYLFYKTRLAASKGMEENVAYGSLFLLQKLKRAYPDLKCVYGHRLFLTSFIMCHEYIVPSPMKNKYFAPYAQYLYTFDEIDQFEMDLKSLMGRTHPFDYLNPQSVINAFRSQLFTQYGSSYRFVLDDYSSRSRRDRGSSYAHSGGSDYEDRSSSKQYAVASTGKHSKSTKKQPAVQVNYGNGHQQQYYAPPSSMSTSTGKLSKPKKNKDYDEAAYEGHDQTYMQHPPQQQYYAPPPGMPAPSGTPPSSRKNKDYDGDRYEEQEQTYMQPPPQQQFYAPPPGMPAPSGKPQKSKKKQPHHEEETNDSYDPQFASPSQQQHSIPQQQFYAPPPGMPAPSGKPQKSKKKQPHHEEENNDSYDPQFAGPSQQQYFIPPQGMSPPQGYPQGSPPAHQEMGQKKAKSSKSKGPPGGNYNGGWNGNGDDEAMPSHNRPKYLLTRANPGGPMMFAPPSDESEYSPVGGGGYGAPSGPPPGF